MVGDYRRVGNVMYRVPLVFTPQPEGGYTVTSPVLPELLTEGDTLEEAYANVRDAFEAVVELYGEHGRPLPSSISLPAPAEVIQTEALIGGP
jgi:antitoxin HicB